ncbi:CPBP family intramembrane glutamic endopeptidase [Liquorilactobacillus aquaticus]|nr:CPBP family intramembrane glutamic endopeptidase [Liquorilactobacillus aquaticus]
MKKKLYNPFLIWLAMLLGMFLFDKIFLILHFQTSHQVFFQDLFLLLLFYIFNKKFLHVSFIEIVHQNFFSIFKVNIVPIILSTVLVLDAFFLISERNSKVVDAITIAGSAAIFEEFFFRGLLLNMFLIRIEKITRVDLLAVSLFTSLMFGFSHIVNLHVQSLSGTLFQMFSAFALGMLLASVYLRTGSLIYPAIFHFILDFSTILIKGFITTSPTKQAFLSSVVLELVYILTSVILLKNSKTSQLVNKNVSVFNKKCENC